MRTMTNRFQEWTQNLVIATVALGIAALVVAITWRAVVWIIP